MGSIALVLVFVSAGAPIPLYNTYRAEDGFDNADLSVATAVYLSAAAVSLLVLGRLSDHVGRRPVGLAALVSTGLGLVLLLDVHTVWHLAGARLCQGLATGMASSALGAWVVDSAPLRRSWLPATITSAAPLLGIPIGALTSGVLVDHAPAPRQLTYVIILSAVAALAAVVFLFGETVAVATDRRRAVLAAARSLRPRVLVPRGAGRAMAAMAGLILATWSLGGFYQAFGPSIAEEQLGSDASLTAGAVFASFTVLAVLGGPLSARLRTDRALRWGAVGYAVCVVGVLWSLQAGAVVGFLGVSLLAGVTQGVAQTGGMRTLLDRIGPQDRAGLLSTVFLLNYSCAAVPNLVAGRFTETFGLVQIAFAYGVLVAVGVAVVLVLGPRPGPRPGTGEQSAPRSELTPGRARSR